MTKINQELPENIGKDVIYIPFDFNDCFKQIDGMLCDSVDNGIKNMTESEFLSGAHFWFGLWIRNNWGLWKGSRLSKYFNELEIYHPDDMSSIILISYHRNLMGQELNITEQIQYYKDYWKKSK
ncbi:MAG: hypothetical protein IMZ53_06745 [Thermoplasmata archaeon]|nr:hypothetical protein [Thermoplasmata archaeon]